MKQNEQGMTLLETMVAITILAIAILHMALVPLLSLGMIRTSQTMTRITGAGKDKLEQINNVLARSNSKTGYVRYDSLITTNAGMGNDAYTTQDGTVGRFWQITAHRNWPVDSGYITVTLQCSTLYQGKYLKNTFTTMYARRDTIPSYK